MLEQLIMLDDGFQPFLRHGDYTFIGPVNQDLMRQFMLRANDFAPARGIFRSIHDALSNRAATRAALAVLPNNTELRIYVIGRFQGDGDILGHTTIEDYCRNHNIDFNVNE